MEFTAVAPGTAPVFIHQPLTCTINLQPGAVGKEMKVAL
jgi:hypothetical protein